jgi:hypothetical protein
VGVAVVHIVADGAGVVVRSTVVPGLACRARLFARVLEAIGAVGVAVDHEVVAGGAGVVAECKVVPGLACRAHLGIKANEAVVHEVVTGTRLAIKTATITRTFAQVIRIRITIILLVTFVVIAECTGVVVT